MLPLLNWPKLDVPVIIGWYIDEAYGVLMPAQVWNKPLAEIDGKIKRYTPRNIEGWNEASDDMLAHGLSKGRIISLRFWIEVALNNQKMLLDEDEIEGMERMMRKFGDPDVMTITGSLNNMMALLQFGTTWTNMLYQHANIMPVSGGMFYYILGTVKGFETTGFSKVKLKTYIEKIMEGEEGDRPIEEFENEHLRIISAVVERL